MSDRARGGGSQPVVRTTTGRPFACSPAAVLVYIVDEAERFLMLRHPRRRGWEVVNGALEAGETVLEAVLREVGEEAGPEVKVAPLGAVHVETFHYDEAVRYMLSISYVVAYQGGDVAPGDDMADSETAWFAVDALLDETLDVLVPPYHRWLFPRALALYRLWKDEEVVLQPPLPEKAFNKYMVGTGSAEEG